MTKYLILQVFIALDIHKINYTVNANKCAGGRVMKRFVVRSPPDGLASGRGGDLSPRYQQPYAAAPVYAPGFSWAVSLSRHQRRRRLGPLGVDRHRRSTSRAVIAARSATTGKSTSSCSRRRRHRLSGIRADEHLLCAAARRATTGFHRARPPDASTASCPMTAPAIGDINATVPGFPAAASPARAGPSVRPRYAIIGNVSVKAEYLFVSLSAQLRFSTAPRRQRQRVVLRHIGRLGLNVHF